MNIKVLSLLEPYASLIKENIKHLETRSWKTEYRGELYIHASKTKINNKKINPELLKLLPPNYQYHYGQIILRCRLTDCILMTEENIKEIKKNKKEYLSGIYEPDRYIWVLEDIEIINPIPINGHLGIWNHKI